LFSHQNKPSLKDNQAKSGAESELSGGGRSPIRTRLGLNSLGSGNFSIRESQKTLSRSLWLNLQALLNFGDKTKQKSKGGD
jgi:hypothetical protein